MAVCEAHTMHSIKTNILWLAVALVAAGSLLTVVAAQNPPGGRGGRGRSNDAFAGQPRINALVISGGGYHDYPLQAKILVDVVSRALPVDWTIAIQGGRGTTGKQAAVERPDWAKGYDIVVHNQCFADTTDEALIKRITSAHRGGPPAIVIHCAMHTYRASTQDTWREFLGVTTRRHTKSHNISVKVAARDHSVMKGFKEDWVTPVDELYVIDKFWPNSKALAAAVSPEDQKEYPLAWVSDYGGTRVFGTTLGHGNDTWNDPVFQDLLVRAFTWAVGRAQ
jgi:type 1 glutamine amidotransferase